jgi:hypothetical protein
MAERTNGNGASKSGGIGVAGQVAVGVATAIAVGLVGLLGNWASQGGLIRALGAVTAVELKRQVADQLEISDIKGPPGPKGDPGPPGPPGSAAELSGPLKVELVAGEWSDVASKNDDGSFVATAKPRLCPEGAILISAYCAPANPTIATGNLQGVGLANDGNSYCIWNGVNHPDKFRGFAQAMCVRISNK